MTQSPLPPLKIEPRATYPLGDFQRAFRFSKSAMRAARRRGLRVLYLGKVGFVRGSDFLRYLDEHGKETR